MIVFDNKSDGVNDFTALDSTDENESGADFLIRILRYLETPQYLRRALFPMHNSLRFVVRTLVCVNLLPVAMTFILVEFWLIVD